jgi:hypothetical protein
MQQAVVRHTQHRNLVAAGVDREQEVAIDRELERSLLEEIGTGATGGEGRARHGRERAVGVSVEGRDCIG